MKKFIESEFGKDITFDQAYGTDENGEKVDWGDCTEDVSRDYFLDFWFVPGLLPWHQPDRCLENSSNQRFFLILRDTLGVFPDNSG